MPANQRPSRRSIPWPTFKWRWPVWAALAAVLFLGAGGYFTTAHIEENDGFCASCHSQPESTFFQRSQAPVAVDLASKHHASWATRCIDCHSGPGVSGRLSGMALGARDLAAFVTHTDTQPAVQTVPVTDATCLKCHTDTPTTQNFQRHFHAFLAKWQAIDPKAATCVSCHGGHATDGDPSTAFLQQDRTQQVCQSCHQAAGVRG